MSHDHRLLNEASELVALSTFGNTRNLVVTGAEIRGPLELGALKRAVISTARDFPQLGCSISEVRRRGRYYLAWHPRPDLEFPIKLWKVSDRDPSTPVIDDFLRTIEPSLERDWNLFEELPGEFHVVSFAHDHHVLAPVIHHVAADAAVASEFGKFTALNYREMVTGTNPESSPPTQSLSTAGKRRVQAATRNWKDSLKSTAEALRALGVKPTLPVGHGDRGDPGQYHVKRMLSVEDTARISRSCAKAGIRPVDLLVVAANLALDDWNLERNVEQGLITTAMTVNIQGRYEGLQAPNTTSVLFFRSNPEERRDVGRFARSVSSVRMRKLRKQRDLEVRGNISRMTDIVRFLPYPARRRLVHNLIQKHQFSVSVTMLGVVWPIVENGRPSDNSYLINIKDTVITEIHGVGYKLLSSTPLTLIAYVYLNRLNLVAATAASLFTRDEAESYMDKILATISEISYEL
ncbi:MAG: hypothetical protein RDU20_03785 [Desulfomonilaceae bacterium]|nr:hypothetical protein [Desulfomonilaceae bacterium]